MREWIVVAVAACCSAGALADDASPNQGMLGDWGGARTRLYQQGLDFQLSYFAEPAYNTHGGTTHLLRSTDQFVAGATFDLDKLLGWPKAKFQATLTEPQRRQPERRREPRYAHAGSAGLRPRRRRAPDRILVPADIQ